MAAYAATVTLKHKHVSRVSDQALGVLVGSVALTNYNSTRVEVTAITGCFKGAPIVVAEGVSSTGHLIRWDTASKAFKSYVSSTGAETANDVDSGVFSFHAFGVAP